MSKHIEVVPILFGYAGAENEIEVEVVFTYLPRRPATGPTYDCGGQPEEPAEIDIISALVLPPVSNGMKDPVPYWLMTHLTDSAEVRALLIHAAAEDCQCDPDYECDRESDGELTAS